MRILIKYILQHTIPPLLLLCAMSAFILSCADKKDSAEYYIDNEEDLYKLANLVNQGKLLDEKGQRIYKVVRLRADIKLTKPFSPIGTQDNPFFGYFDGQNHTISGLFIEDHDKERVGLFGFVKDSHIQSFTLDNINIKGKNSVAGVCGYAYGTMIMNCSVSGSVYGECLLGGIAGELNYCTVDDCSFDGDIIGTNYSVGGIAGSFEYGAIMRCHSTGEYSGNMDVSGIVGSQAECMLIESASKSTIKSAQMVLHNYDKLSKLLFSSL